MDRVRAIYKIYKIYQTYGACEGDGSHGEDVRVAEQVPEPRTPRAQPMGAPENTAG